MTARTHRSVTAPRPVVEFPARCGECHAARVNGAYRDPITLKDYNAVVRHDGTCPTYRQRAYDRAEPVAHLMSVGGARQ